MDQDKHQRLQGLYNNKKSLEDLQASGGWKMLKSSIDEQCRARRVSVFQNRITDLDKCFELATLQGEVAGMQFAGALLEILLHDINVDINGLLTQAREEEEDEQHSASDNE
ncbi:MAG TPA: hypothetical protein VLH56_18885 [Dissulfurispiraceae bacterium]|nr:hypothetical protein [Dissulfurispiraceae bacterium]